MALITPSTPGNALAYQAAAGGGDTYTNSGKERLHVRNGGGSPITATAVRIAACNQGVVHAGGGVQAVDQFVVGNGSDKVLPALDPNIYGSPVSITYSGVTSVTVGVIAN